MKITVLTEYVRAMPWSMGAWAADIARALASRGHDARVACDGAEDPSVFGAVPALIRRPERTVRGGDPLGFQAWARERGTDGAEAVVSLTPLAPGDVWAPLGDSTIEQLAPTLRDRDGRLLHPVAVAGLMGGLALMFATGLLVSV